MVSLIAYYIIYYCVMNMDEWFHFWYALFDIPIDLSLPCCSSHQLISGNKRRDKKRKSRFGETTSLPIEQLYDDIYDLSSSSSPSSPLQKLFGNKKSGGGFDKPTSQLNIGIPREYLKVTKLNSKYDSYQIGRASCRERV